MNENVVQAFKFLEHMIANNVTGNQAVFINAQQALEILKAEIKKQNKEE